MKTPIQNFLSGRVRDNVMLRNAPTLGDLFGFELECEGSDVAWRGQSATLMDCWRPLQDGSLRNHHGDSQEWVFREPLIYDGAVESIVDLFKYFDDVGAELICSNRTSTHVHFNMSDKSVYQLFNVFIAYSVFEDILAQYCGEDRAGNLFCLSGREAYEQVARASAALENCHFFEFTQENRYCAVNLSSINKFGSVEFRAMRGLDNASDALDWLYILKELCMYSCYTMKNPVELLQDVSAEGPSGVGAKVFTKQGWALLTKGRSLEDIDKSVYDGVRMCQALAYRIGREWGGVEPYKPAPPLQAGGALNPAAEDFLPPIALPRVRGEFYPIPDGEIARALEAAWVEEYDVEVRGIEDDED